jgi:hypothetical protein
MDRWAELEQDMPSWDDVVAAFDPAKDSTYVEQLTLTRLRAATKK